MNKKRSLCLVVLLAFTGFAALVWVSSYDGGYYGHEAPARITYGLNAELKWMAMEDAAHFAVVQDTLGFYAARWGVHGPALGSRFQLDHCCDDPALRAHFSDKSVYRASFNADFSHPAGGPLALQDMVDRGYLRLGAVRNEGGWMRGHVSLRLPVPGQPGRVLEIQDSQFELSWVPRVAGTLG
jgi:hypothetical protein